MMSVLSRTPESRSKVRPFSIIPIIIISLALGWTTYSIHQPSVLNLSQTNGKLGYGRIESIDFKERSMYMTVDMLSSHAQGSTILLTTKGCNYSLAEGDNVAFVVNLQRISNPNMPEDTDFALIQKIYTLSLHDALPIWPSSISTLKQSQNMAIPSPLET